MDLSTEPEPKPGEYWICGMSEDRERHGSADRIPRASRFVALLTDHGELQWHAAGAEPRPAAWVAPILRVELGEAPAKPRTVLRRVGPLEIEIARPPQEGEAEPKALRYSGAAAVKAAAWYGHMMGHGEAWGHTYLAGVIDGLALHHESDLRRALDRLGAARLDSLPDA